MVFDDLRTEQDTEQLRTNIKQNNGVDVVQNIHYRICENCDKTYIAQDFHNNQWGKIWFCKKKGISIEEWNSNMCSLCNYESQRCYIK